MTERFPIVYIRGYAMTEGEIADTFNRPYYGFNLGCTQIRQGRREIPVMRFFESPVVRLLKDEKYVDSFNRFMDSADQPIPNSVAKDEPSVNWRNTLWIFRFYDYDPQDEPLEGKERDEIEDYAESLARFLDQIRVACGSPAEFAVNLVAHSMGGLIARCYLQNKKLFLRNSLKTISPVKANKLFTYGTPHRGITFRRALGWIADVRDLFGYAGSDTFGPKRMRQFLDLQAEDSLPLHTYVPVDHAPRHDKVMCLIGTNFEDYVVWTSKRGVGPGSDGLVAIENAYIKGAHRAYVHRAHSGPFGLVNSEEGYQNLTRFLFGDLRFEVILEPLTVKGQLPGQKDSDRLDYLLVDVKVAIRGLPNYVQNRTAESQSAIAIPMRHDNDLLPERATPEHLYTGFLRLDRQMTGKHNLRSAIDLKIEPHYLHEGPIRESRFDGEAFFQDRLHIILPEKGFSSLDYFWKTGQGDLEHAESSEGDYLFPLPMQAATFLECPGIRVRVAQWS